MLGCSPTRPVSQGIVRAIRDYQVPLKEHEVTIFVRRGGPNYQEGLRVMGEVGMLSKLCLTSTFYLFIVNQGLSHIVRLFFPLRQNHRNPHPRLWHGDPHDGHCRHGAGPPANPQPASRRRPHRQLPPQLQRQHVGELWCRAALS